MKNIVIFFLLISTLAPGQDVVKRADEMLLNSEYNGVLQLSEQGLTAIMLTKLQNRKAEALIRLGKLDEARKLLDQNLQGASSLDVAVTDSNLGLLYLYQGRNDLALQSLQRALKQFDNLGLSNSLEAAQTIAYLGQLYKFTGKSTQAEEQLLMSLAIRKQLLTNDDHELIAASYNDLGLAYVDVDNDKALDYYEKALSIYTKIHGDEHPKIALINSNMGLVYRKLELYGDAVNDFETALKIWEKVYADANPTKAFTLHNLGQTYAQMGNVTAAEGFYNKALAMYKQSYGAKHPDIAQVLNDLGNLHLSERKYDKALQDFQEALCANVSNFNNKDVASNPSFNSYYNGRVLLYSLLLKADGFESRHFGKSLKLNDLTTSINILQRCDTLIDRLRQQSTNESDKIALGAIANEVYANGVRTAYEAATVALKKKKFQELAFYFAEKSKSAVLLEAISESDAKSFAGIPQHLLEEERDLKSAIALTAQKLAQKPSPTEEQYLRETSFALSRSYESFVENLEKQYPSYFNLKYNAASPSIGDVQSLLDDKTAVLSYFIDEENQRLYTFYISRKKYKVIDHLLNKTFDKHITGLRNGIYFNVSTTYAKSSNELSKILIPTIPSAVTKLIILPTGRLGIIPFEALSVDQIKSEDSFDKITFLVQKKSVQYEFSAGMMLQKVKQTASPKKSILLCAPIEFPQNDNLAQLPGTESEVQTISELFKARNIPFKLYTRYDANEHTIKTSNLSEYNLIHFATHGIVDENSPELSRIFLQKDSGAEDGNLFAGEIYNLKMNADLVTLSACQTGLGKISKGEGVIGLSRALVYAGAKNIIVSFWSVADESTSDLMQKFYNDLLVSDHADYGESLRSAKLQLMKEKRYQSPYYWAPFILIGF